MFHSYVIQAESHTSVPIFRPQQTRSKGLKCVPLIGVAETEKATFVYFNHILVVESTGYTPGTLMLLSSNSNLLIYFSLAIANTTVPISVF